MEYIESSSHIFSFFAKGGVYAIFFIASFLLGLFVFIYTHFYYHIDLWLRKRKIEKIANKFYYNDHDILAEADYTYLKLENFGSNLNKLTTILEKVGNNSNTSVHANSIVNNSLYHLCILNSPILTLC